MSDSDLTLLAQAIQESLCKKMRPEGRMKRKVRQLHETLTA